jgi:hypothetical protein
MSAPEDTPGSLAVGIFLRAVAGWGGYIASVWLGYHTGEVLAGWVGALAWTSKVTEINEWLDGKRARRGLPPFTQAVTGQEVEP